MFGEGGGAGIISTIASHYYLEALAAEIDHVRPGFKPRRWGLGPAITQIEDLGIWALASKWAIEAPKLLARALAQNEKVDQPHVYVQYVILKVIGQPIAGDDYKNKLHKYIYIYIVYVCL